MDAGKGRPHRPWPSTGHRGSLQSPLRRDKGKVQRPGRWRFTEGFSEWPVAVDCPEERVPLLGPFGETCPKSRDSGREGERATLGAMEARPKEAAARRGPAPSLTLGSQRCCLRVDPLASWTCLSLLATSFRGHQPEGTCVVPSGMGLGWSAGSWELLATSRAKTEPHGSVED